MPTVAFVVVVVVVVRRQVVSQVASTRVTSSRSHSQAVTKFAAMDRSLSEFGRDFGHA